jgi:hypothetical protein
MLDSQVPSNIPGRTDSLIATLGHYDHAFETRWFRSSFMDPIWTTPLPMGHCLTSPPTGRSSQSREHSYARHHCSRNHRTNYRNEEGRNYRQEEGRNYRNEDGRNKRTRLGGDRIRNPDFINHSPLMECTSQVPQYKTILQALYGKFQMPVSYPRFPTNTGTLQTLCLNSSFVSPHHTCTTRLCGDRKSVPRMARLHIDLSKEEWKNKPEAYWAPMMSFLLHAEVTPHIKPTQALRRLTPSTKWP